MICLVSLNFRTDSEAGGLRTNPKGSMTHARGNPDLYCRFQVVELCRLYFASCPFLVNVFHELWVELFSANAVAEGLSSPQASWPS